MKHGNSNTDEVLTETDKLLVKVVKSMPQKQVNENPYDELPASWKNSIIIKRKKGTKWFEESGDKKTFELWLEEIHKKHPGNLLPLQWAADLVRVSRTAVLNKAKKGELFVFSYIVKKSIKSITGTKGNRQTRKRYDYVLISELKQWEKDLMNKYGVNFDLK